MQGRGASKTLHPRSTELTRVDGELAWELVAMGRGSGRRGGGMELRAREGVREAEAGAGGKPKQDYRMGIKFDEAGSSGGAGGNAFERSGHVEGRLAV